MVVFRSKRPGNDRSFSGRLIGEIFAQNDRGRFLVIPSVVGLAREIKEWYRRFKNGRTSVDSDPRSGRPSLTPTPENVEGVRLAIEGDRRLTVRELENDLGIPKTTVWKILNKILGMTRVCAKFIPKLLTTEQKGVHSEIAQGNLEMVGDDENVPKKVITGDE